MDTHGAAVTAAGFGLKGPRGWAFRELDIDAGPGSLIAIEGPSGSGRTCLLLALTGRMKPSEGQAEAGGLRLPRKMAAVRRISALGPVPGVSELDPSFTVAEHLHERALLQRRFDGSLRALLRPRGERSASARTRIEEALETAGLDPDSLPKAGRTAVRDLERLEALRLSVALGLIGRPRLLAVDDTDLKLSATDRAEAWGLLRRVTATGTTVLAVCSEAPEDAVVIRTGTSGAAGRNASGTPGAVAPPHSAGVPAGTPAESGTDTGPEDGPAADTEPEAEPGADSEAGPQAGPATEADAGPEADADPEPEPEPEPDPEPEPEADADPEPEADPAVPELDADSHPVPEPDDHTGSQNNSETEEGAADALAETGRA